MGFFSSSELKKMNFRVGDWSLENWHFQRESHDFKSTQLFHNEWSWNSIGTVELRKHQNVWMSNLMIAIQLKSGTSNKIRSKFFVCVFSQISGANPVSNKSIWNRVIRVESVISTRLPFMHTPTQYWIWSQPNWRTAILPRSNVSALSLQ